MCQSQALLSRKRHTSWPTLWQIAALALRVQLSVYSAHKPPLQQELFQTLLSLPVSYPLAHRTTLGCGLMGLEVELHFLSPTALAKKDFKNE